MFRWMANLVELRVVDAVAAANFISKMLEESSGNSNIELSLVLHCAMVFLTTENVCSRLEQEAKGAFETILG